MTTLIGGTVDDPELEAMAAAAHQEDWYEIERASGRGAAVGVVEHGTRDVDANAVWHEDGALGVVYGVVSNRDRLGLSWGDLFRGVLDDSRDVLERLDGPFALACVDTRAGVVHLATDKAGSRPLYYAAADGIRFASELTPLLEFVDDPELDDRAIGDLLVAGGVLGDRTLVEGIDSLPPATHLVYDGTVATERYWEPESAGLAPEGYPARWLDTYREALGDVATTSSDLSLWLSGDVDSRVAAGVLADRSYPVETVTHGARGGGDRESAAQVAAYLGLPNRQVHDDPDGHLVEAVGDAVAATDAMVNWAALDCLPYVADGLHADADVVLSGGSALGAFPWAGALQARDSAASALYENERALPAPLVRDLLSADVDPLDSFAELADDSVDGPTDRTAVDAARRLRAATTLRSRAVHRSQVGTRTLAHGELLDTATRMPACYRMETLSLGDSVTDGVPPIRREVVRRLDPNLAQIPGGRRSATPSRADRLRADGGDGRPRGDGDPYVRQYLADDRFRRFVDDLLARVRDRDEFDADAVADLHDRLRAGKVASFTPIAALTGLELWAGRHLDGRNRRTGRIEA